MFLIGTLGNLQRKANEVKVDNVIELVVASEGEY